MKRCSLILSAAAGVLLAATAVTPLTAQAEEPDPTPGATPSTSALTPREVKAARQAGVNPAVAQKETRNGLTMLSDATAWVVLSSSQMSGRVRLTADFDAGICAGRFYSILVVKNVLEWGAESSCSSTAAPNDLYPHSVSATLRQGNTSVISIKMYTKATVTSPASSHYSRVASIHGARKCLDGNTHKFDQVVNVTVHGTKFGPKVSPQVKLVCGV